MAFLTSLHPDTRLSRAQLAPLDTKAQAEGSTSKELVLCLLLSSILCLNDFSETLCQMLEAFKGWLVSLFPKMQQLGGSASPAPTGFSESAQLFLHNHVHRYLDSLFGTQWA